MTDLQQKILGKRHEGLSYRAIAKALSCSDSTVRYWLKAGVKEQAVARNRARKRAYFSKLKSEYGAQCAVCGYDRCPEALEFDHVCPHEKVRRVSASGSLEHAKREAEKCLLLCCRCHRERHAGLLDIGAYLEPSL